MTASVTAEPVLGPAKPDPGDNAPAETINGRCKAAVIHRRGPWRSFAAVAFATLERVDWFNNRRRLKPIGNIPPAQAKTETACHAQLAMTRIAASDSIKTASGQNRLRAKPPPENPARFTYPMSAGS